MASKRRGQPLLGSGNDAVDYRRFARLLLSGAAPAIRLIESTVSNGTQQLRFERFVPDPNGELLGVDDSGAPVRARREAVTVSVARRRLTRGLEWDEP